MKRLFIAISACLCGIIAFAQNNVPENIDFESVNRELKKYEKETPRNGWSSLFEYYRDTIWKKNTAAGKLSVMKETKIGAGLQLAEESIVPDLDFRQAKRDTLVVKDDNGGEVLIMKAIKDEETGEMVATDVINAALVTARFRNVAERHGKVDISFNIIVPEAMMDSKWQLRFNPDMYVLEDSLRLDPVIITGAGYRKAQLKGYQQYERFLSKIVSDTTKFVNIGQLELFLERNIPEVYAFKTDSTEVSDEIFYSIFGVSERQAVEHYTNQFAKMRNKRRIAMRQHMYRKYVKAPIVTEGIRLDTIIQHVNGDFEYVYTQTINTRPKLRRVDIVLSGDIYEQDKKIYNIPRSEPLTFYISSVSSFVDNRERYLTEVIERRAEANASYHIDFALGKADVDLELGENFSEIGRIKDNLADLMQNTVFDLDSIVVTASASPEGSYAANDRLSQKRSESVSKYIQSYMKHYQDSLDRDRGFSVDEEGKIVKERKVRIPFIARCNPENWVMLDKLIEVNETLTDEQKEKYRSHKSISDFDAREAAMKRDDSYAYIKDVIYPSLRTVKFNFNLHRKGMVKDTVHTTVLDSAYMKGVQAIRDRDYEAAVVMLSPYQDYNTAVAYVCLDRNRSALEILQNEERTAQVNYMLAIVYARLNDEEKAVKHYLESCRQEPTFVHRGNLDPEISALIKLYGLNRQEDDIPVDL